MKLIRRRRIPVSIQLLHLFCFHEADAIHVDDPEIYDGAHVAIQLVGRRLQEEKMIALARYMGEAVHGKA